MIRNSVRKIHALSWECGFFCAPKNKRGLLLRWSACHAASCPAFGALASDREHHTANADSDVDWPFEPCGASQDHVDEIPTITDAKEITQADQAPVDRTGHQQIKSDCRNSASFIFHNDTHKKLILTVNVSSLYREKPPGNTSLSLSYGLLTMIDSLCRIITEWSTGRCHGHRK